MFDKQQIMEFKEAFNIMDTNEDGFVDAKDLEETFQRLGQPDTANQIERMINEAPGPINFTVFLTLMADKLTGTDPENIIINAFAAFDEDNKGIIKADDLREYMTTMGDRFTDEEVDIMFKGSMVDEKGNFHYKDFVRVLKHGE
ncbi:Myosin regulatory light chain 12B [Apophysomyces ossiformis]|uniref:Myosin regulatory light chain 12B n=1 Tax=Apophysomyces ossiformis TaxID=679940 RepID=A0A8H7BTK1_9FUNG|nr:Myosin regulatory light chain 12B [Apophysomyces ossiformis]